METMNNLLKHFALKHFAFALLFKKPQVVFFRYQTNLSTISALVELTSLPLTST
jgi:hypothetical protein